MSFLGRATGRAGCVALSILVASNFARSEDCPLAAEWRYIGRPQGTALNRPLFQFVPLQEAPPEGVVLKAKFRGHSQRYGLVRYGDEESARVLVSVDALDGENFDLYVDADRDRVLEARELVPGEGRDRTLELSAQFGSQNQPEHRPRQVLIRRPRGEERIAVATLGFAEGPARLQDRTVAARRLDGDGNGLFGDAADRVWLDVNADGKWDAFSEQFSYTPILRLGDDRYAVRGDRLGDQLTLERIEGVGQVRLKIAALPGAARIEMMRGTLVGDDGSAYAFGDDKPLSVPVGQYAVGMISLSIADGTSPKPWTFVFSTSSLPKTWHAVRRDEETVIDPIGQLTFVLDVEHNKAVRPEQIVTVRPRLYTSEGLLINASALGPTDRYTQENDNCAVVMLTRPSGDVCDKATTGFA